MTKPSAQLSPEQESLLRHEVFISEIVKTRGLHDHPKPWWHTLLESGATTALITVVLGGWIGHYITSSVQEKIKDRELALAQQKELAAARFGTVKQALEEIGDVISRSEDLIDLAHEEKWNILHFPEMDRPKVEEQKARIREAFNLSDTRWRKTKETRGLLLYYYSNNDTQVRRTWARLESAVDNFTKCAQERHALSVSSKPIPDECENERGRVSLMLQALTTKLRESG